MNPSDRQTMPTCSKSRNKKTNRLTC